MDVLNLVKSGMYTTLVCVDMAAACQRKDQTVPNYEHKAEYDT
jgi:hypothetical protein